MLQHLVTQLNLPEWQVKNTVQLLEEGATVPFISRYRKEATGSLDEMQVLAVKENWQKLQDLEKRRQTILKSIAEQGALSPDLKAKLEATFDASTLEDLYLPFKQKRKTRATKAKERGLEGLAKILMKQQEFDPERRAQQFVKGEVKAVDEALQGARDIIAEWISEHEGARKRIRQQFQRYANISSKLIKGKEEEGQKFKDYFKFEERLSRCPSHRLLAVLRGAKEGVLRVSIGPDETEAVAQLAKIFVRGNTGSSDEVQTAVKDSYKRLIAPAIETEFRNSSKVKADLDSIRVFSENLRQLLLAAPLGQKRVLAIDPGFRTGCKVVCLDAQGNLLHNETIFPHPPKKNIGPASNKIRGLVGAYKIDAIAIGNGTAGRETEQFIKRIRFDRDLQVFVVSEDGASIYSASKVAREEFPEYDVTVRGAVSIGRRLMDPLAELVKIEAKSLGVGQYQHDVDQTLLQNQLDQVVESAVNAVGVDLNTASKHLLAYVSGVGPQLAENIIAYRKEHGAFQSRKALKEVKRMGAKAMEQCSAFLRIPNAIDPLDNSAVHPERYGLVKKMAKSIQATPNDLIGNGELIQRIDPDRFVTDEVGLPTINDILAELEKPGRDPRRAIKVFEFAKDVRSIEDLKPGQKIPGIVNNVTNFGAFVDIGIKQKGLIHVSQLADRFVSDPNEIVKLNQHLEVRVLSVDVARNRIQLSLKEED